MKYNWIKNIDFDLPDLLSIFRIILAVILVILAFFHLRTFFSWLLLVGLITDWLDGFLARKNKQTSKHGAQLDSMGDASIFLGAVIGIFLFFETDFFLNYKWLLVGAMALYFFQLGYAYWKFGKSSSFHTYSAKVAAFVQGAFLVCTSFFSPWEWLFFITLSMSILETLEEISLLFIFKKPVTNVKGIYWVLKNGKENYS
ncbi:CDP-alcohol phosphatidyltransferase family protein [Christiangramia sp.]|uniref:CDP-alcohol phosphatidyltransferase family protein n=1 Tax=Christiangramia sp. TaxID=1931228 RepID=UPI0026215269|nr:CDP-alcohol phosphatidyltransferase family protein [Christiangramia sp.]